MWAVKFQPEKQEVKLRCGQTGHGSILARGRPATVYQLNVPRPTPYPYSTPCTCKPPRQRVSWRAKVALRARSGGHACGAACRAAPGSSGLGPKPWLCAPPSGAHAPAAPASRAPLPGPGLGSQALEACAPAPPGEHELMRLPSVDGEGATVNRPRISDDILCISALRPASVPPPPPAAASAEIAIKDPLLPAAFPGDADGFCAWYGKHALDRLYEAATISSRAPNLRR